MNYNNLMLFQMFSYFHSELLNHSNIVTIFLYSEIREGLSNISYGWHSCFSTDICGNFHNVYPKQFKYIYIKLRNVQNKGLLKTNSLKWHCGHWSFYSICRTYYGRFQNLISELYKFRLYRFQPSRRCSKGSFN